MDLVVVSGAADGAFGIRSALESTFSCPLGHRLPPEMVLEERVSPNEKCGNPGCSNRKTDHLGQCLQLTTVNMRVDSVARVIDLQVRDILSHRRVEEEGNFASYAR